MVNGRGPTTGNLLTTHPKIAKISFTGSTIAGRQIMKASSESNLKVLTLELGGKSPIIIFDDADLDNAVKWVINGAFANTSQNCICSSRVFLHENIYNKFVELIKEKTKQLKVGNFDKKMGHLNVSISSRDDFKFENIFYISYMWNSVLSILSTLVTGLIISFFTNFIMRLKK